MQNTFSAFSKTSAEHRRPMTDIVHRIFVSYFSNECKTNSYFLKLAAYVGLEPTTYGFTVHYAEHPPNFKFYFLFEFFGARIMIMFLPSTFAGFSITAISSKLCAKAFSVSTPRSAYAC